MESIEDMLRHFNLKTWLKSLINSIATRIKKKIPRNMHLDMRLSLAGAKLVF